MARAIARCVGLALTLLVAACARPAALPGPYPTASIILISIDTLRADRLPAYGYGKGRTPHLDRIAREGIVVDDALGHCPLTLPAHASLFTGLLPPRHGVRDNLGFTLAAGHATLAQRLREAGFRTGGAVSAYVLRSSTGIARGFESWDDRLTLDAADEDLGALQRDGALTVESLSSFVAGVGTARVFAFLHLYEPHAPYTPPARHGEGYDGEVAYADELVGRFLEPLRTNGLLDRSLLVVTSDHGEGLGDHGEQEHGLLLYREALRVPLIIRLPGGALAGRRVAGPVAQADVPATLLDLVGLAWNGTDGVSLRAALAGSGPAHGPVYSETFFPRYHLGWSELRAASDGRFRYVDGPRPELFDLASDPGERTNLIAGRAETAAAMEVWLDKAAPRTSAAPEPVSAEVRERLQALGYVGQAPPESAGPRPDPREGVADYEALRRGLALKSAGRGEEATALLRELLARRPEMLEARHTLGLLLAGAGRAQQAIQALGEVLERDPARSATHLALARILTLEGRFAPARAHAELAAAQQPAEAYELLAQIALSENRLAEAAEQARRSLDADPQRLMSHFALGVVAQRAGRFADALASFARAAELQRRERGVLVRGLHAGMADCLARLGREAEAEREFQEEIRAIPASREGRVGLAMLYRSQGRDAQAREVLAGLIAAEKQPNADSYWTVVKTLGVLADEPARRDWASRARALFPQDSRFR